MSNCRVCNIPVPQGDPFCKEHDEQYCICCECGQPYLITECKGNWDTGFTCNECEED